MAVGGTNRLDAKYSGSNTGPEIDITAPGQDVFSLSKNSGYSTLSGTSMATPHVSGLASLIRAYNPALTLPEIENIIKTTAEDKGPVGFDTQFGWGRINAHAALAAAAPKSPCNGDLNADLSVNVDDLLTVVNNWGLCPEAPGTCDADFVPTGGDGSVNVDDLLGVINNWGACGPN
jgi:subtilisin family serine protease